MATETKTFYPGAYDSAISSFISIVNPENPVGKGSSNGSSAQIKGSGKSPGDCYWPFDVSAIPSNAKIESVSCVAKVYKSATSGSVATLQLCSGNTPKGSSVTIPDNAGVKTYTISGATWSRSELELIRLRTTVSSGGTPERYINFYGADLTVEYTVNSQKFMLKLSGSYHDIARVFQKIDGIWIEQDDLNNVVVSENGLVNGGEIESAAPPVNLIDVSIYNGSKVLYSYQAEEGMTWEQWAASSYNTGGWYWASSPGGNVTLYNGEYYIYDSSLDRDVLKTDVIVAGRKYSI